MFDWNDLRYFLAVARTGSTLAAAKAIGLSQSTVQRRLAVLEQRLNRQLVERHPTGYKLTALGEELRSYAEQVEEAVAAFERRLASSDKGLTGVVRVTCPEGLANNLALPLIEQFHARYPGLRADLVVTERILDLSKGEAEIAIRGGLPTDPVLICRKLSDNPWAVYASRSYLEQHDRPRCLADIVRHKVIGFSGDIANVHFAKWFESVAPRVAIAARSNTIVGLMMAAKSGAGLAILPAQLGDPEPDLVRVLESPDLVSYVYLLVHPDLQHVPRVRAFVDFIFAEMANFRPLLSGRTRPQS
ncbi:MAG: LysR family transcriptional regulator [Alphaproteobacteria bacterium]|nr:LysR family transcriptional regulator [Alphaproteobacteria bacterium]